MTINQKIGRIALSINYLISNRDEVIVLIENIFDLNVVPFIRSPDDNDDNDTKKQRYPTIVDTGACISVIIKPCAQALGLKQRLLFRQTVFFSRINNYS